VSEGIGIGLFIPFLQALGPQDAAEVHDSVLGTTLGRLFDDIAPENRLPVIALAIFGAVILKAALTYAASFMFTLLSARTGHDLRRSVFDRVLATDTRSLDKTGSGRLLNVLSRESWRTADAITLLLQSVITSGTLFVFVLLLLLISWRLTLIVTVILFLIALVVRLLTRRVGWIGERMAQADAKVVGKMVEGVNGLEVIRSYGLETRKRTGFVGVSEWLRRLTVRQGTLSGAVYPIYEVIAAAVLVTVLLTSYEDAQGLAPLLVFVFLLYRLAPIVKRLEQERVELLAAKGAVTETYSILHRRLGATVPSGSTRFDGLHEALTLADVGFRYGPDVPQVLSELSLQIPATGLTAIVGPSGAGKSTLIKLLLRFFDPTEGRILVGGTPLTDLRLDDWRSRIAVVPQKVFLFSATVRENIAYGALEADDEQVIAAASAAGAHEFITRLPEGYDTRLGEEGDKLSGGEAQRICLARALIRKPDLLLLDEATNALDSISEELIQQALEKLRHSCAVVVVAHRLATVERADQILVLDDGQLVEQGNLNQLLQANGLFARLYKLQRFEQAHERSSQSM
jgi:subfamily B ATP-binding cassette protein MsbA